MEYGWPKMILSCGTIIKFLTPNNNIYNICDLCAYNLTYPVFVFN